MTRANKRTGNVIRNYASAEKLRSSAEAVACDDFSRHLLTFGGQNGEQITYVVTTESGEEYYLSQADIFTADTHLGSIKKPFVL